jgi:hypothetical protein
MSRGPATFRQRDVSAAINAALAAGVEVARVEIGRDGRVIVVIGKGADEPPATAKNEWDEI